MRSFKEVVTRSRLTVIEFNKGEDEPLEQYNEGEMSDDSDVRFHDQHV